MLQISRQFYLKIHADVLSVMVNASNTTIGGNTAAARNVISGSGATAIYLEGSGTIVQGNYLGTDVTGTVDLGNTKVATSEGTIRLLNVNGATIGGTAAGQGNLIAFGGGDGVLLQGSTSGVAILGNSIHSHAGVGIDLWDNGVSLNDTGDGDAGANGLQNFPVLTSSTAGPTPVITGTLNSTANRMFRVEFFANGSGDGTGFGEGQRYLGFVNVTTNGSGNVSFTVALTNGVATGEVISATATDLTTNDTSEFAQNITATNTAPTLNAGATPVLTAQNEDSGPPSGAVGTLISSLVDFASPAGQVDNVTDPNAGAALGIAITAANTAYGTWFYSTNAGGTWNALGAVGESNARLLAANASTRLYFQPAANYNGTIADAITFRAWDQTIANNGAVINLSPQTVLDQFSSASYANNNGTANWSSNWTESNDDGSPTSGNVVITGGELVLSNHDVTGSLESVRRSVDLSSAGNATLSFDFRTIDTVDVGDSVIVEISGDGGGSWTTLSTSA